MHWEDVLEIEFLQLGHHLAQTIVGRRSQAKTADQRVDFLDAGDLLRPPQRIDDAGMAAGADDDKPAVAQAEAGGVLVPVLAGLRLAGEPVLDDMGFMWALAPQPRRCASIKAGIDRSARGRRWEMLHLDRIGSLLGLPQIILQLQLQPALRRAPEPFGQPNRHVGGNSRTTIEQRRERAPRDAEALSGGRYRQLQRIEAQLLDDLARMRRVVHARHRFSHLLAVQW
jgi:hypothetical protein